jgi:AbrB family looped-hinge helix DNA binding protein
MEKCMATVTVSPKFQILIPKSIRKSLKVKPGQKMQVFQFGNRMVCVPEENIKDLRGIANGITTDVPDDEEEGI